MRRIIIIGALAAIAGAASFALAQKNQEPSTLSAIADKITPDLAPKPFVEPNLKLPKDSGGIVTSELVADAPLDTDFVMGKKTATLNVIEYASLTCPHCAHFAGKVLPSLQKNYIATGKIRYILRQFPLNEPALKGAMLVDCMGDQGDEKYYTFNKVLFDAQNKWAFDGNFLANLETIAGVGGIGKEQFVQCTTSTDREMAILKRQNQAKAELKIGGTPFIIVGNEVFTGERTPETLGKFIDKKLAEMGKK